MAAARIGLLADRAPAQVRDEIHLLVLRVLDGNEKDAALRRLCPLLSPAQVEALAIQANDGTIGGLLALASIFPWLPAPAVPAQSAELLRECLDEMPTPRMRAELLTRIAPYLPDRDALVREAWSVLRRSATTESPDVDLMVEVAGMLAPEYACEALAITRKAVQGHSSVTVLADLIKIARAADDMGLLSWTEHWGPLLTDAAASGRADLAVALMEAAPALHRTGGEDAVVEVLDALHDVRRWWP